MALLALSDRQLSTTMPYAPPTATNSLGPTSLFTLWSAATGPSRPTTALDLSPTLTSPIDCDYPRSRLVRKKSGEPVKSSLSRPRSLPATPSYSKSVHFDSHLCDIRHFKGYEKPAAVNNCSKKNQNWVTDLDLDSDIDLDLNSGSDDHDFTYLSHHHILNQNKKKSEWQIELPNFPRNSSLTRDDSPVFLQKIFLSNPGSSSINKTEIVGHIAVKNLSYNKHVSIKYTTDYWKTISELVCDYNDDIPRSLRIKGYDRFTFNLKLNTIPQQTLRTKSLFLCVRYISNGNEYWDNNQNLNYEIIFKKLKVNKQSQKSNTNTNTNKESNHSKVFRRNSDTDVVNRKHQINSNNNLGGDYGYDVNDYFSIIGSQGARPTHTQQQIKVKELTLSKPIQFENLKKTQEFADEKSRFQSYDPFKSADGSPNHPKSLAINGSKSSTTTETTTIVHIQSPPVSPKSLPIQDTKANEQQNQNISFINDTSSGFNSKLPLDYKTIVDSYCFFQGQGSIINAYAPSYYRPLPQTTTP